MDSTIHSSIFLNSWLDWLYIYIDFGQFNEFQVYIVDRNPWQFSILSINYGNEWYFQFISEILLSSCSLASLLHSWRMFVGKVKTLNSISNDTFLHKHCSTNRNGKNYRPQSFDPSFMAPHLANNIQIKSKYNQINSSLRLQTATKTIASTQTGKNGAGSASGLKMTSPRKLKKCRSTSTNFFISPAHNKYQSHFILPFLQFNLLLHRNSQELLQLHT